MLIIGEPIRGSNNPMPARPARFVDLSWFQGTLYL